MKNIRWTIKLAKFLYIPLLCVVLWGYLFNNIALNILAKDHRLVSWHNSIDWPIKRFVVCIITFNRPGWIWTCSTLWDLDHARWSRTTAQTGRRSSHVASYRLVCVIHMVFFFLSICVGADTVDFTGDNH